jgi:hypothetical protein
MGWRLRPALVRPPRNSLRRSQRSPFTLRAAPSPAPGPGVRSTPPRACQRLRAASRTCGGGRRMLVRLRPAAEGCMIGAEEAEQGVLQIADAITAHLGFPLGPEFVKHSFPLTHEGMPAVGHRQAGSSRIARTGAAENISALFQERDRLGCRLPGDRRAPAHLRDRVGSRSDSTQREIVGGTDTGVPSRGKPVRRFVRHEPEPPEEQQRQVGTTSRHASTVPAPGRL